MARGIRRLHGVALAVAVIGLAAAAPASAKLGVTWMKGYVAPGTPAKFDKVGVIKVGARSAQQRARAGARDLGRAPPTSCRWRKWIVSRAPGWQVWSVEPPENLLEDQSELNLSNKQDKVSVNQMFNYYLGYLSDSSITHAHPPGPRLGGALRPPMGSEGRRRGPARRHRRRPQARRARWCSAATRWAARWSPPTPPGTSPASPAPTSWPGSSTIDGGSSHAGRRRRPRRAQALATLATSTPWLAFGGVPAPVLGLFSRRRARPRRSSRPTRRPARQIVLAHAVGAQAAGARHQPGRRSASTPTSRPPSWCSRPRPTSASSTPA